jgi:hypothetical protein
MELGAEPVRQRFTRVVGYRPGENRQRHQEEKQNCRDLPHGLLLRRQGMALSYLEKHGASGFDAKLTED